jgi:hypothetical protein
MVFDTLSVPIGIPIQKTLILKGLSSATSKDFSRLENVIPILDFPAIYDWQK